MSSSVCSNVSLIVKCEIQTIRNGFVRPIFKCSVLRVNKLFTTDKDRCLWDLEAVSYQLTKMPLQLQHLASFCFLVAVQTHLMPPKKMQPGMVKSSLVHASVATMQNPMGYDPRTNGHCTLPRLSISSRSASMVASLDASSDGSIAALHSVMKWKTVMAVFVVVVLYLVAGALAFKALEQPFESNQKTSITLEKASFLERNPCVTPSELDAIIKVSAQRERVWRFYL